MVQQLSYHLERQLPLLLKRHQQVLPKQVNQRQLVLLNKLQLLVLLNKVQLLMLLQSKHLPEGQKKQQQLNQEMVMQLTKLKHQLMQLLLSMKQQKLVMTLQQELVMALQQELVM
jgi:hypothetical protein